jgi:predicted nucleic-acid-binding Zn-ribbon protein
MMKQCPECGSTEIIPDLLVFADEATAAQHPPYVSVMEPEPEKRPFIWMPKSVSVGFRAAVCGECGYTHFYTKQFAALLDAHKKGYKSQQYRLSILLPM